MKWWVIGLIAFGSLVIIVFLIKFLTRNNDGSGNSENNLLERARGGIRKLADCCKKLKRW